MAMPKLTSAESHALDKAFCALVDHEGQVRDAMREIGRNTSGLSDVIDALRALLEANED